MNTNAKLLALFFAISLLPACTSVEQVGEIGPKKLKVYSIDHNSFLSSSNMLVVLNDSGDLSASTGGVVSGGGTVGLQAATSIANSGALAYGANQIAHGVQNANVTANVKGIPKDINVNANANLHATGKLERTG